ncbi:uncharacterized protein LOC122860707 isoform X2 [Aphidius gifuensis]|nr:uncharacterized protein LOC122860707 isoform X2 [Aphidius gifuensis]XP_044020565.1 uncharacterized protein LOC122860707 isoform X2 [Aphidius gifuensis]
MKVQKSIDEEQAATVEEHFQALIDDDSSIDDKIEKSSYENLPEWYNEELFKAGQCYYRRNLLSMAVVSILGVLSVIIIPTILRVLVWTKKSGTTCTAFKRYLETIIHIHSLYTADINNPNSRWWKSLNEIKLKHATNSRRSGESGPGGIYQRDMALTQFGFIGYALLVPDKLGLTNLKHERNGLNHFWRVVGYMLGISNKLNICRKDEIETTALCRLLQDKIYAKHMNDEPEKFNEMALALLGGLWYIDLTIDADCILYFWYEISGLKYAKPLGIYSQINYKYRKFVVYLLETPIIGFFIREYFNYYLSFCYWLAEVFPIFAKLRFGNVHSKIHLYTYSK